MSRKTTAQAAVRAEEEEEKKRKLEDTKCDINAISVTDGGLESITSADVCEGISRTGQLRWAASFHVLRSKTK